MTSDSGAALRELRSMPGAAPASVSGLVGLAGVVGFVVVARGLGISWRGSDLALGLASSFALPVLLFEILVLRSHARPSAGLGLPTQERRANIPRAMVKLLGVAGCVGMLALCYWVFPEYQGEFYDPFWAALERAGPWLGLLALPYVVWVDRRMTDPHDGYWHLGALVLGRTANRDWTKLRELALGWAVKAFFLPLMFVYMSRDASWLVTTSAEPQSFLQTFHVIWRGLFAVDVTFAALGYALTLRALDGHVRSSQPTWLGWSVALVCYQPFWGFFSRGYLDYGGGVSWESALRDWPATQILYGCVVLGLIAIYVWATITFGVRFSNLTHRGVLSSGPYRWTKHPAYIAKNLSWWLTSLPFLSTTSSADALRGTVMLLALSCIYFMRARTEERHLRQDPAYRVYETFVRKHGLWAAAVREPLQGLRGHLAALATTCGRPAGRG